jgi:hypothetical protein
MSRLLNRSGRLSQFQLVVACLILLAGWQTYTIARPIVHRTNGSNYINIAAGRLLDDTLTSEGMQTTLAQVAAGSCRYVVVYSNTCGASLAAARQWARAFENGDTLFPGGWVPVWVDVDLDEATPTTLPPNLPVLRAHALRSGQLESSYSITAFPVHIILDRSGRVVESSVGAALPTFDHLTQDCREVADTATLGRS